MAPGRDESDPLTIPELTTDERYPEHGHFHDHRRAPK